MTINSRDSNSAANDLANNDHLNGAASCVVMPDNTVICTSRIPEEKCNESLGISSAQTALGEEKELALLFLDIRNFTTFMESRSPYDVIYVIRKLFSFFNESIEEAGGKIVETAGDSIYAVFGLDYNIADAVKASAEAAKAIFQDLQVFNSSYAKAYYNIDFEIGIGIHSGKVVVGHHDLGNLNQLTVMGLPVNIAARLQSMTKKLNNNYIISEAAYSFLDRLGKPCEKRRIKLKGVTGYIDVRLVGTAYLSMRR